MNSERFLSIELEHNLRSPLSVILGMVHFLNKEPLDPIQKQWVNNISESAKQLLLLANNLSDTRIEPSQPIKNNRLDVGCSGKPVKKILLIEDNQVICLIHKKMLLEMNYDVDVVGDSIDALRLLENKYELILLDIGLPGMNGIELAKIIREGTTKNKNTIIFAITAFKGQDIKNECLAVGINQVLTKPISCNELDLTIKSIKTAT